MSKGTIFSIGNLADWEHVAIGELIDVQLPSTGYRVGEFEVLADGNVSVRVITGDTAQLVAYASGLFTVRFAFQEDCALLFEGDLASGEVMIKTGRKLSVVPESEKPSHATIQPRGSEASVELKRMMHMVRLNSEARERALMSELQRLRETEAPRQRSGDRARQQAATARSGDPKPKVPADPDPQDE